MLIFEVLLQDGLDKTAYSINFIWDDIEVLLLRWTAVFTIFPSPFNQSIMKQTKHTNLLLTLFIFLIPLVWGCKKTEEPEPIPEDATIEIAALLSMSGNWSTLGVTSKAAIEMAIDEANDEFLQMGLPYKLRLAVLDTKLEPNTAATLFSQFTSLGGRIILGPQSSSELAAIRDQMGSTPGAMVISHSSTAGNLAIANDGIYRFCPADVQEGNAVAQTMTTDGIKALVALARNDDGNKGLQIATTNAFSELGGQSVHSFEPYSESQEDFTDLLQQVKAKIEEYSEQYGSGAVGVYLASFDECVALFNQAATDPIFSSVRWYGSDGVAHSGVLINDAVAAEFAEKTQYFAPTFGLPSDKESVWSPLLEEFKGETGLDADAFTLAAYDAVKVIAKTLVATWSQFPYVTLESFNAEFINQANSYSGATGSTSLNEFGDREHGTFDYWAIQKQGSSYQWVLSGRSE